MTRDLRLFETASIPCLHNIVVGTELGQSSLTAFNSKTTVPKPVFTDCWDLANPNSLPYDQMKATIPLWKIIVTVLLMTCAVAAFTVEMVQVPRQPPLLQASPTAFVARGVIACEDASALGLAGMEM
jgi:hypothetical protein